MLTCATATCLVRFAEALAVPPNLSCALHPQPDEKMRIQRHVPALNEYHSVQMAPELVAVAVTGASTWLQKLLWWLGALSRSAMCNFQVEETAHAQQSDDTVGLQPL